MSERKPLSKAWLVIRVLSIGGIWAGAAIVAAMHFHFYKFENYFEVGEMVIPPVVDRTGFDFEASSGPLREFAGSYKVILRDPITNYAIQEYPKSGVFPYRPKFGEDGVILPGYPGATPFDWWVGQTGAMEPLDPVRFYAVTCWTVHDRPFPLSDVTGCVESNVFRAE